VNPLITEAGHVGLELNGSFTSDGEWAIPAAIRYTPSGDSRFWGRTEYSLAVDGLDTNRVDFLVTTPLHESEKFNVALVPDVTSPAAGYPGVRIGASVVARWDVGLYNAGLIGGWSGATSPSDNNPAGQWDFTAGVGRHLGQRGWLQKTTPYVDSSYERSTAGDRIPAVRVGVEYQATERFSVILSTQQHRLSPGHWDHQVVLGVTADLGPFKHAAEKNAADVH